MHERIMLLGIGVAVAVFCSYYSKVVSRTDLYMLTMGVCVIILTPLICLHLENMGGKQCQ